jgi:hypothetical protein
MVEFEFFLNYLHIMANYKTKCIQGIKTELPENRVKNILCTDTQNIKFYGFLKSNN